MLLYRLPQHLPRLTVGMSRSSGLLWLSKLSVALNDLLAVGGASTVAKCTAITPQDTTSIFDKTQNTTIAANCGMNGAFPGWAANTQADILT